MPHTLAALRIAMSGVRDQLSGDVWRLFGATERAADALRQSQHCRQVAESAGRMLTGILSLQGVTASMIRDEGWHMIEAGRYLERAVGLSQLLRETVTMRCGIDVDREVLNAVLLAAESAVTHRRRYRGYVRPAGVLDLLLIDPDNPRSLAFCLGSAGRHLEALPGSTGSTRPERLLEDLVAEVGATEVAGPGGDRRGRPAEPGALPRRHAHPAAPDRRRGGRGALRLRARAPPAGDGHPDRAARVTAGVGMRYRVSHRTTYSYDDDVSDSLGIGHLMPRELAWQQVTWADVRIDPAPGDVSHAVDLYGNIATYFQVTRPHRRLDIEAASEVDVGTPAYDEAALAQPWERARPLLEPGDAGRLARHRHRAGLDAGRRTPTRRTPTPRGRWGRVGRSGRPSPS